MGLPPSSGARRAGIAVCRAHAQFTGLTHGGQQKNVSIGLFPLRSCNKASRQTSEKDSNGRIWKSVENSLTAADKHASHDYAGCCHRISKSSPKIKN
jgi:hypothetical protein